MTKSITLGYMAVVFAICAWSPTPSAQAALISDEQVEEQKEVLQESVNAVLREEIKLIQMVFIQLLELRIEQLKDQLDEEK